VAKSGSILAGLTRLPWWANVILAIVVYLCLKYLAPALNFGNAFYAWTAKASGGLAPFCAAAMLVPKAISILNNRRREKLPEGQSESRSILSMSRPEFETLIRQTYIRRGYSVTETGGVADGAVDLILSRNDEELFIRCKHWKLGKVGVKEVRKLYQVISAEGASGGIFICSGEFTPEASDFAEGKPVELVDGVALARMIEETGKSDFRF